MLYDRLTWACVAICAAAATIWALLGEHFHEERHDLQRSHEQRMDALRQQWKVADSRRHEEWMRERAARLAAWEREGRNRREAHGQALEEALGGPRGGALKNPDLSIREMLLEAAKACAPSNTDVEVTVDRFTEFEAAFAFDSRLEPRELVPLARCFLGDCAKYVNAVRFISGSELLWEIDKGQIDAVADWKTVSLDRLVALRTEANGSRYATGSSASDAQAWEALQPVIDVPDPLLAKPPGRANTTLRLSRETWKGSFAEYEKMLGQRALNLANTLLKERHRGKPLDFGKVTLRFREHSDGRITDAEVIDSEVGSLVATTCLRGLLEAGPYPRWSDAMRAEAKDDFKDLVVTWVVKFDETSR